MVILTIYAAELRISSCIVLVSVIKLYQRMEFFKHQNFFLEQCISRFWKHILYQRVHVL